MVSGQGRKSIPLSVRLALVGIVVALCSADVPTQSAAQYGIADLGTLGGSSAAASDVSEYGGTMVGQAQTSTGVYQAFRVGQAQTASGQEHTFSYSLYGAGGMVDLGTLGGTSSAAYGTEYGIVVGASKTTGDARLQAFAFTSGAMSRLAFDWGGDSVARAVRGGLIVGYACTSGNASCRAFSFRDGVATNLGSFGGNSVANAANYNDQIAGTSALGDQTTTHAFLYANGALTDLGTLGGKSREGLDINSRGDIVGTSDTASSGRHAFLWQTRIRWRSYRPASLFPPGPRRPRSPSRRRR
ncbi:MAG: hypothetical protein AUH43_06450 [Acidobacteria bacterium 13_1_40CM_65_14]|nr:MAG: hypothetical protein AUH43_06450 [Acidobacteria bacterium 13_1_40CM_65_14]